MTISSAITPLFTHFLPILFFMYMMMDVLLRNRRRTEHRLVFAIIFCCMLLFIEEFVRYYLPIEYSPKITTMWFSTVGITFAGLGLHLFLNISGLNNKMPKYIYPFLCYIPVVLYIISLLVNDRMVTGTEFHQVGIWKLPIYNKDYYIAMIGSNIFNVIYIIILFIGKRNVTTGESVRIYNQLILGIIVSLFLNLVLGLIEYENTPPYPYIYGTLVWCILLRYIMLKYEFLNHIDKRYEKLFKLNPTAIILIDLNGNVKEANPSSMQLFNFMHVEHANIYSMLDDAVKIRINAREEIKNFEMTMVREKQEMTILIDGDYVMVEYEPHLLLIVRDITLERENQRELSFLAYHDALTRLPNRRLFFEKLDMAIQNASNNNHQLAVVLFDLDHFKEINDKYGHQTGDRALIHVANLIREILSTESTAARLGGDEFMFFLHPISSVEVVEDKIQQLQHTFQENKLMIEDEHIPIHLSIGVSFFPQHGLDGNSLLNNADKALYHVKRQGRNSYTLSR